MTPENGIITIDGYYVVPKRAAVYLVVDDDEAAFIDNATRHSVPLLLKALANAGISPDQVRYLIVTHVHLDHCGGTAELAKHCPNATILAHPRATRHIIDPTKLVEAARPIYGDQYFEQVFGVIEPVAAERVQELGDGETRGLGNRSFAFLHTPGHAKHHLSVHDRKANVVFSGDAFGLAHLALQHGARPYLGYVASPPDYTAEEAKESVRRILECNAEAVYVTHFGKVTGLKDAADQLYRTLDKYAVLVDEAVASGYDGAKLLEFCSERALVITEDELRASGLDPNDTEVYYWATLEHSITSQGIAYMARRMSGIV